MKKIKTLPLVVWLIFVSAIHAQTKDRGVWVPDNGDGTYKNPIIHQDYSDPDVVKVGDDFFMTASSFNCVPGLPILHSKDLVNWALVNYAIPHFPDNEFDTPQHGNGVWAPSIRFHDGCYYIYWGDPDRGIYMVKTTDPMGKWSAPVLIKKAKGNIDPSPLWDEDGKVYLVHAFARSRSGVKHLLQIHELSPEGDKVIDDGTIVFDGNPKHPTIEGPKFIKRNGYYYIFAPGGGVSTGWQVVLRSKNIFGPYEDKIVLAQGDTEINGPHQGGYVELENGEGWFLHFQDKGVYGRIVHMQPVKWNKNWPVMGADPMKTGTGEPVLVYNKPKVEGKHPKLSLPTSDDFTNGYGLQWQWHANFYDYWYSTTEREGHLRLHSQFVREYMLNLWEAPNLFLQKFPAPAFTATAKIDFSNLNEDERAGLVVMGYDIFTLEVEKKNDQFYIRNVATIEARRNNAEKTIKTAKVTESELYLRVVVEEKGLSTFFYSTDGKNYTQLGDKFQARQGHWIGAKVGLFANAKNELGLKGYIDIDNFIVE